MKRLILTMLLLTSFTALANPPCTPQWRYYTGEDKYDWQAQEGRLPSLGWGWPARQMYCEDIWVIWVPTMYRDGGWETGHWAWLLDGNDNWYFKNTNAFNIFEATSTSTYTGKVYLRPPQPWYRPATNQAIMTLANYFNTHGIYWGWW